MSSSSRKTRKSPKGKEKDTCAQVISVEVPRENADNPKDDNPITVQQQIENLTATLNEHAQAIHALKDVPSILVSLSAAMEIHNAPDVVNEDQNDEIMDDDELLSKFNGVVDDETQSELGDNADESLLEILELSQPASEYGDSLSDPVAKSFRRMVESRPTKEKIDKWKEDFKPPENCKVVGVPRINVEIWPQLKPRARHGDLSHQQQANYLTQAMVATGRLADKMFDIGKQIPKESGQELLRLIMDIGGIIGLASQEISVKRKLDLKTHHKEFAPICSSKSVPTEWLFGDNVVDQLKASKSAANAMKPTPSFPNKQQRFHPYKSRQNLNYKRPSFQPKGGMFPNQSKAFQSRQFQYPSTTTTRRPT